MERNSRGLFITGTGTDVGKTYVSALIVKMLREAGYDAGYYKAAISGIELDNDGAPVSDASHVAQAAGLTEPHDQLASFSYRAAVSPHLAARLEGNPVELETIQRGFAQACQQHQLMLVEGSGGIACPLRWDDEAHILLEDVIQLLGLSALVVADAGLGTLNALATTAAYLEKKNINAHGIILNNFEAGNVLHEDNLAMAERLTNLPVLATVAPNGLRLSRTPHDLATLFAQPALPHAEKDDRAPTWQSRDLAHIWHPCSQMKDYEDFPPIIIERGEGTYLYDADGKDYLDIISSWWCNTLGHCNPRIAEAVKQQVDTLDHVLFANFSHKGIIQLAEELTDILPQGLTKLCFSDNGSTSVECALKMSFQYHLQSGHPEKQRFMCLSEGYHGETLGALSVCADAAYAGLYAPLMHESYVIPAPDCYRCPYGCTRDACRCPCFEQAERQFEAHGFETCAVIVEPLLQGSAGMRMYPPLYLEKLRALCDAYGTHLIADEVATGFGRTGTMFAFDQTSVSPDMLCASKNLTGGFLPMAATATTEDIYQAFYADYADGKAFMHSHTYAGNPIAAAAALAVQRIMREDAVLEHAAATGDYLHKRIVDTFGDHPHVGEVRRLGLINALELVTDKNTKEGFDPRTRMGYRIYRQALDQGLMLRPLGNVMYFNPPLTITKNEIDCAVDRAARAMRTVLG